MYYLPKIQICTDADTWHGSGSVENFLESISKENKKKPKLFVQRFQEKHFRHFWGKVCFNGSQLFWHSSDGRESLYRFEIDDILVGCIYMGTNTDDK